MNDQNLKVNKNKWTWLKPATFIISVITVLIIFLQSIFSYFDKQQSKEIDYCSKELKLKMDEINKIKSEPKIDINIKTLEEYDLPNYILKNLPDIPSTIEIRHFSGETVKGLSMELISTEQILRYENNSSLENLSLEYLDGNRKILRIDAARIRSGAIINLKIFTNKIPAIKKKVLFGEGDTCKKSIDLEKIFNNLSKKLSFDATSIYKIYPDIGTLIERGVSEEEIILHSEILMLKSKIEKLYSQSFRSWLFNKIIKVPFLLAFIFMLLLIFILINYIQKRNKFTDIITDIQSNKDRLPSLIETISRFGNPDETQFFLNKQSILEIELRYFSSYFKVLKPKGLVLTFVDNKLEKAVDIRGKQLIE
ncbi:MAG: hypothetical protein ACFFDN_51845 [Candidatus Hodarchaeota archaeon]